MDGCTCAVTVVRDPDTHASRVTRTAAAGCPVDHSPVVADNAEFRWMLSAADRDRINKIRAGHGLPPLGGRRDPDEPEDGVPALLG